MAPRQPSGAVRLVWKRALRRPTFRTGNPVLLAAFGVWALLLGMLMLMLGNGLQGTLIGVRANAEEFATTTIGVVMSGYFIGFLAGSKLTAPLLGQVGHLRVFAALASLVSVAILVHSLLIEPWIWFLMRILTGFAFAGIYIVTESWLNDRVSNEHRGGLLSIYMIISYAGLTFGQLLLNVADPGLPDLFILVAILVSLAAVPILLVVTQAPVVQAWTPLGPRQLFRESHLGAVGACASGVAIGAVLSMGPVFAASIGKSAQEISIFMAAIIGAGAVGQWPIGRISDRFDRRRVILWVSMAGGGGALLGAAVTLFAGPWTSALLIGIGVIIGAAGLALYPLIVAYTNDRVRPDQMVGAGSSLIMLYGVGAIAGPLITGQFMEQFGPAGFFWLQAGILIALGAYTGWRIERGRPLNVDEQIHWGQAPGRTPLLLPAWLKSIGQRDRMATAGPPDTGAPDEPAPDILDEEPDLPPADDTASDDTGAPR